MIIPMAQTQKLPQHLTIMGNPFHHGSAMVPDSPIALFASSLGEADYRNPQVQVLPKSSSRSWQVPATSSDLHIPTRWPNNSIESSTRCSPSLDSFATAYSELFDSAMRSTSADGEQQFVDGSTGRYSASVASMLSGGSSGLARTLSSPLGGALGSTSPRLTESWTSTVDHGNMGLAVDPSRGGLALQGAGRSDTPSLPRFSTNPGFAERAARFSAFGSGQYSPAFPLAENGNGGRSPCFENDSSKRAKVSVGVSRRATSATEVPEWILAEGRGAEKGREEMSTKGEPKTSASKPIAHSTTKQIEQDDAEKEWNADEVDGLSADSDASEGNRGQQEASCSDQVFANQGRTTCIRKKRKSSSADDPVKEGTSSSSKEQKGSGGQWRRSNDGEGANDTEEHRAKSEWSGSENSEKSNFSASKERSKAIEQPKLDYIHVRARRGQATDSHSLAERVRREKISERMKYLQDLVPGCSKVTGKAVMLDEIINYVQSLQRQVEFLSMKLAFQNPRRDFHHDRFLGKDGRGSQGMVLGSESSIAYPPLQPQQHQTQLQHGLEFQVHAENTVRQSRSAIPVVPPKVPQASQSNMPYWDDGELHSVVHMGFGEGRATPVPNRLLVSNAQHKDL